MGGEREKTEQMNGWVRGGVCGTEKNKNASSALIPKTAWCGAHLQINHAHTLKHGQNNMTEGLLAPVCSFHVQTIRTN